MFVALILTRQFVGIAVKRTYLCIGFSTGLYATSYVEEQVDSLLSLEVRVK